MRERRWELGLAVIGVAVTLLAWAFPDLPFVARLIVAALGIISLIVGVIAAMRKKPSNAATPSEVQAEVDVNATDADSAEGMVVNRPTRIKPGTTIKVLTERVKKVTGLRIGGSD